MKKFILLVFTSLIMVGCYTQPIIIRPTLVEVEPIVIPIEREPRLKKVYREYYYYHYLPSPNRVPNYNYLHKIPNKIKNKPVDKVKEPMPRPTRNTRTR